MRDILEIHYQIQKDIFFSDKIVNDNYNLYYSNDINDLYRNYAILSSVAPVKKIFDQVAFDFSKLGRKICVCLQSNQTEELKELLERKMRVNHTESWLRYDGVDLETFHPICSLSGQKGCDDFVKFLKNACEKKGFEGMENITPTYLSSVIKSFDSEKYFHFVAYENDIPVSVATLGSYKGYSMIYNLVTLPEYRGRGYTQSIVKACIDKHVELGGKEIYIQITKDSQIEQWYANNGFKKLFVVYGLSV